MILPLLALLLFQAGASAPVPQQALRDPGVIATGQRVTPAGVQSVFEGKVGGVRFGATSADVWVAVPGYLYRVDWRSSAARAVRRIDGRPGIFALAVDSIAHRVFASSVGRRPQVTRLNAFELNAAGDSIAPALNSGSLGDYMAGAPAIATRAGTDGKRLGVLPLPANDALAVIDADRGTLLRTVPLGVEPIDAVISSDSRIAYVSILGGAKPRPGERAAAQCCDPRAEAVRIDARGVALGGTVSRVDLSTGAISADIPAGRHPTAMAWDEQHARLYVVAGNADSITIIDTSTDRVLSQISIAPFRARQIGLSPTALALSPDRRTLYVALGGVNAVAVYDIAALRGALQLRGLIPTAWYPSTLDVSTDGRFIAVGSLFGLGSGVGSVGGKRGRYALAPRGSVHVVSVPTPSELTAYSTAVSQNNRLPLASMPAASVAAQARVAQAVPTRPGDSSLVSHVVFIVKENRTYDQVLGDLDRGNGDSSLVEYGRDVTPNTHALSQQFVTLDHFFTSGGNSADGHQWLTQANETDYPMWPLYVGRSYPSEGIDPLAYSSGAFLWEVARAQGRTVSVFGEYAPAPRVSSDSIRRRMMAQYRERPDDFRFHRQVLADRFDTRSAIPTLDRELVREYPGWTEEVPDVMKAGDVLSHLGDWEKNRTMPNLVMIVLPNDHTMGTSPGWCTPKACVADNDYALGKIVDGLSHSSFWKDMAILVVEDDAQNGVDHLDGHRTVALAISPWARRGIVDSTSYSQPSMVKTVELMLGLPAMSIFDLVATDMRASFIDPGERPNLTPYDALEPVQSLLDVNPPAAGIQGRYSGERRRAARASARMSFDGPDEAPADALNRILWHDARGWDVPYPAVRRSLLVPQAADIADEDRKVKAARP